MGEEDDNESPGVRRRQFSRGVGNLGEAAGDCGAVDKLGMGVEVVDWPPNVKKGATSTTHPACSAH